jgi:hypothetical protein
MGLHGLEQGYHYLLHIKGAKTEVIFKNCNVKCRHINTTGNIADKKVPRSNHPLRMRRPTDAS